MRTGEVNFSISTPGKKKCHHKTNNPMTLTLEEKNELIENMISVNCDVTIADYLRVLYGGEPPNKIVKDEPLIKTRFSRGLREPVKDPSPFKRFPAEYDNRGHYQILDEL